MTVRCERAVAEFGSEEWDAYTAMVVECAESLTRSANVEDVLSRVRTKLSAMMTGDVLAGATHAQLERIEEAIRTTIADAARPADSRIPAELPHHALARWIGRLDRPSPIELFTTNYDTLLERALEDRRVAVFDGFTGSRRPYFSAASMAHPSSMPGTAWTRLWKLHGSVNWSWRTSRAVRRHESLAGTNAATASSSFLRFTSTTSRASSHISRCSTTWAVFWSGQVGQCSLLSADSFSDEHINEIIFDALDAGDRTHVIALQYEELDEGHELIRRASRRRNLIVYGPSTAVVAGVLRPWALADPVDNRTAELLDIPFDSDATPDVDVMVTAGRFRLGDFNYFTRFLDSIAGDDD